jgi:hypothetical protein
MQKRERNLTIRAYFNVRKILNSIALIRDSSILVEVSYELLIQGQISSTAVISEVRMIYIIQTYL